MKVETTEKLFVILPLASSLVWTIIGVGGAPLKIKSHFTRMLLRTGNEAFDVD